MKTDRTVRLGAAIVAGVGLVHVLAAAAVAFARQEHFGVTEGVRQAFFGALGIGLIYGVLLGALYVALVRRRSPPVLFGLLCAAVGFLAHAVPEERIMFGESSPVSPGYLLAWAAAWGFGGWLFAWTSRAPGGTTDEVPEAARGA
jgi:hypothetical protein